MKYLVIDGIPQNEEVMNVDNTSGLTASELNSYAAVFNPCMVLGCKTLCGLTPPF